MKRVFLGILLCLIFGLIPVFSAHAALTTSLESFWKLDEASGSRADSVGSNTLTDNNTVTQAAGKIGTAAQFTSVNAESLSRTDNASLSTGDIDFTIAGWVYLDAKTSSRNLISKWDSTVNQREYLLTWSSATDRFNFNISTTGSDTVTVGADTLGAPSTGTWYYVVAWHDSAANTINIQVNNGTVDSAAHSAGIFDSTASFMLGSRSSGVASAFMDGRIDALGFWKRVLTADERASLYNAGSGAEYPFVPNAPTALTAAAGDAQATLAWTAPTSTGVTVTDYVIEYKLSSEPTTWTTFADGTSTTASATVTGLTNDSFYDFRVSAVNAIGTGSASTAVSAVPSDVALKQNLFAFWKLDEASGTRDDAVGSNDLTDNNTVTQAAGKVGNAAQFTAANSESLSTADNASLSTGDIDFTLAGWVYFDSFTGSNQDIVGKWDTVAATGREYIIFYDPALSRLRFAVSSIGSNSVIVSADTLGAPSTGTWYYVVAWHDSAANTINIQVNNGTVDSTSHSAGVIDTASAFKFGYRTTVASTYHDGRIDATGLWKRVLTSDERTSLYNGGFGVEYPFTFTDIISITTPVDYQVFQRDGSDQADITITGSYSGSPVAIEASWNGGAYATIDASPSGGTFSGSLTGQAAGQGTLSVRFTDDTSVNDSVSYVGIGDVFVIAGQSNAVGLGTNNQVYSHATLKAALFGNDDVWKELVDPTDDHTNQVDAVSEDTLDAGSMWPLVATLFMADQNVPVAFIPTALSATQISEWQRNDSDPDDLTTLYGSMYRRINEVGSIKAVLFYQGERDASLSSTESTYKTRLDAFAADVQSDFGVKVVAAQIGNRSGLGLQNPIRLAQQSAWNEGLNVLPGPAFYDVDVSDGGGDGVHLKTDAELQLAANRFWAAIAGAYYGASDDGRGPILVSSEENAARTAITVIFSDDSLPILPSTGIQGFIVEDNGSPVTVTSALTVASNAVRINLQSALAGTATISLGDEGTAAGLAVPTDSSTYNLPAEIFIDEAVGAASAPVLAEVTPVTTPTSDSTPDYTFSSTEAGTISYGGDCASATTSATAGSNTITFATLPDGTYSNCTITVTDIADNASNILAVTAFTVDTSSPATAPDAPTALTASAGDTDVELTWTAPADDGGSAITDYLVEYKLSTDSSWTTFTDGTSTSTSATVTGLTNNLAYDFRVSATNAVGTGAPSSTDSATPTSSSPPPSPSAPPAGSGYTTNPTDIPGSTSVGTRCSPGARFDTMTGAPCTSGTTVTPAPNIPTIFTRDLKLGDTGADVRALQVFLNTHGFTLATTGPGAPGNETQFFGALTKAALIRFQEAYAARILTPLGLTRGTGYFGEGTREWILGNF